MFYLKNDDMEELFRKAAENYELDASKASDWEGIHKKLHEDENASAGQEKKKKRRFIFWWFLLFPAGWMAHNTWDKIGNSSFKQKPVILQQQVTEVKSSLGEKIEQPVNSKKEPRTENLVGLGETENKSPGTKTDVPAEAGEKISGDEPGVGKIIRQKPAGKGKPVNITSQQDNTYKSKKKTEKRGVFVIKGQQQPFDQQSGAMLTNSGDKDPGSTIDESGDVQKDKTAVFSTTPGNSKTLVALLQRVDEDGMVLPELSVVKYIPVGVVENYSNINKPVDSLTKAKVESVRLPKDRYFYAQVIVAPDLTSVKFQRIAGTGSSIGLLLGYRFNKRLHVEAGGYWEKKVYYTKGQYFDKSKLDYFNNHEIYNVDGNCHMITIPVNLRYNFISKKNSDWFVTGGAAAYLMQKEYYDITYEYYGDTRTRGYTYKNAPKSWLATVNVGVGYQTSLWKSFNFRVEPYVRVPVSGVGTGNLSLTSAGIYIGIGRKF